MRKKDESLRLCVDCGQLNRVTTKIEYLLPKIDDLFFQDRLEIWVPPVKHQRGGCAEDSAQDQIWALGFLVMPFGLANAPAAFMNLMDKSFQSVFAALGIVFIDDALVHPRM